MRFCPLNTGVKALSGPPFEARAPCPGLSAFRACAEPLLMCPVEPLETLSLGWCTAIYFDSTYRETY